MPPRRGRRAGRPGAGILAVFAGVRLSGVVAIATLTGSWLLAVLWASVVSTVYLPQLAQPWNPPRPGPLGRFALRLFLAWWAGCLTGWILGPLALLVGKLAGAPLHSTVLVATVLSALAGLRAQWPHPRLVRRTVPVPGLPATFDGYRILHLTDVHCGPWTPPARVRDWVSRINALEPDLVAVTGDLITHGTEYVDAVASALGGLRARDGVFASMGNHDYFTDGEAFAHRLDRAGLAVLRNRGRSIARGDDRVYVAGVDDTWTRRDSVPDALAARPAGAPTVLLAHDPALFLEAAAHGVELVLSGHTHGGQIAMPGLSRKLNLARLMSPFTVGVYRYGRSTLYVNRGAGTTGPPIRLGAPAEIAMLTLRAA